MKKVKCVSCKAEFEVEDDVMEGEIVECSSCGQEHEVEVSSEGEISVALAPEIEETWGE
ncbi:MAG: lysine biosynthesis protein LysW [Clostridium sp.]|nr:lysine biosynthesis protein LysW [Clostridium sp.]